MENKNSGYFRVMKKIGYYFLLFLLASAFFYPILFMFAPLFVIKILLFPLWSLIQGLTLFVINLTGWDVWIARGIALLLYSAIIFFLVDFLGNLAGGFYKYFFKKERRLILLASGCAICMLMYFVSKDVNFSPVTGEPLKKYLKTSDGNIELFPIEMNYHPVTGEPLEIINSEIMRQFVEQKRPEKNPSSERRPSPLPW